MADMISLKDAMADNGLVGQILRFLGISGLGWILDFITYSILGFFCSNLFLDNVVSSLVGATFVFLMSPRHIFSDHGLLRIRTKYVIYVFYQMLLILCISYLLSICNTLMQDHVVRFLPFLGPVAYLLSKMAVTPVAMTCNFVTLKLLFEKL